MNGITYVKLQSPYQDSTTKNAPLTVVEMDSNFATLEGRDVQSVTVENDILTITLYNGKTLSATMGRKESAIADVVFDHVNGTLTVAMTDGSIKTIEGFATKANTGTTVAVDNTLVGNGLPGNPVGISPVAKTGLYRPVERILNVCENQHLPDCRRAAIGERYLTIERVSDFGYLYDYNGLRKIACDLRAAHSPWRVPSKADWDDMLDAIEPTDEGQTHTAATVNKYLGQFAGKLLKSRHLWRKGEEGECVPVGAADQLNEPDFNAPVESDEYINSNYLECADIEGEGKCGRPMRPDHCHPMHCGDHHHFHGSHHHRWPFGGLDKYGFRVTPAGYADDGGNFVFFRERAAFWTSTNSNMTNAYVKRFEYNKNNVHQDIIAAQNHLSIRLVKDFDGTNYNEREDILGQSYNTVIMPSAKKGSAIWTAVNVNFGHSCYAPMVPNDGQGMSFTQHFFINEWNGKEWVRNEIRDGEGVIVKFAPDGSRNAEYRVVEGHLGNVAGSLIKTVSGGMRHILNRIENTLEEEITRSTEADGAHDLEINAIKERLDNAEKHEIDGNGRLRDLEDRATALEGCMDNAEGRLDGHDADIEGLGNRMSTAEGRLDGHDERLATAEGRLDGHDADIAALDGRMTAAEGRIEDHEERIAAAETKLSEHEETLAVHNGRIETLEGKVAHNEEVIANHEERMTAAEQKIVEGEAAIADINRQLEEQHVTDQGLQYAIDAVDKKVDQEIADREKFRTTRQPLTRNCSKPFPCRRVLNTTRKLASSHSRAVVVPTT